MNFLWLFVAFQIKAIIVDVEPIYEDAGFPYSIVNFLHYRTRKGKIKQLLYFKEGDIPREEVLRESERRLRGMGIFRDVKITATPDSDTVFVSVKDLFSLSVYLDYAGGGNRTRRGIGLQEHNLLGYAMDIGVFYRWGYEKDYFYGIFKQNGFLFTPWVLNILYEKGKTGYNTSVSLGQPALPLFSFFYYAGFGEVKDIEFIYENGKIIDTRQIYKRTGVFESALNFSTDNTWKAIGLNIGGVRWIDSNFLSVAPFILLGKQKYEKTKFLRKFGDDEDFFEGLLLKIYGMTDINQIADRFIGLWNGKTQATMRLTKWSLPIGLKTNFSAGYAHHPFYTYISGNYNDFWERYFNIKFQFFYRLFPRLTFAFNALYSKKIETIFGSPYFFIGGTNGLRGYNAFYFKTKEYGLFNLELRAFGPEILKIFSIGGLIFYDIAKFKEYPYYYSNLGLGIRVEFTRNYSLPILRFDIAFKSSREKPIFSFGEGQLF